MSFGTPRDPRRNGGQDLIYAVIRATQVTFPAFAMMWLTKCALYTGIIVGLIVIKVVG